MFLSMYMSGNVNYTWKDMMFGTLYRVVYTIASIFMAKALEIGDGGPLQAIENQKSTVLTILVSVIYQISPNKLDIMGMIVGFIGINIIIF